jgi:hypothetical protein
VHKQVLADVLKLEHSWCGSDPRSLLVGINLQQPNEKRHVTSHPEAAVKKQRDFDATPIEVSKWLTLGDLTTDRIPRKTESQMNGSLGGVEIWLDVEPVWPGQNFRLKVFLPGAGQMRPLADVKCAGRIPVKRRWALIVHYPTDQLTLHTSSLTGIATEPIK